MALELRLKPLIWKRYNEEQPGAGHVYEEWCARVAADLNIQPRDVEKTIASESVLFQAAMQVETRTLAQQTAHKIGLTEEVVLSKIKDGLNAKKKEVLYFTDFEGRVNPMTGEERLYAKRNPVKDEDGNWVCFETDDERTQAMFVREAVGVLAMHTPDWVQEKVIQQQNIQIINLPDDQVAERLRDVEAKLSGITGIDAAEAHAARGTAGARVRKELPHVVDARYEDLGRAGRNGGEPYEAVPAVPVHPARNQRVRKRTDSVPAQE